MDRLWAPWRINYVQGKKTKGCIFCKSVKLPEKNYVLICGPQAFSMLNIFPYNNGHAMVAPRRHVKSLSLLREGEFIALFKALNKTIEIIDKALKPQGFNIGINLSRTAGAGITGHLHIHIVPRWEGDTNFMPVLYNTRIIPQSLDELYKRLKDAR